MYALCVSSCSISSATSICWPARQAALTDDLTGDFTDELVHFVRMPHSTSERHLRTQQSAKPLSVKTTTAEVRYRYGFSGRPALGRQNTALINGMRMLMLRTTSLTVAKSGIYYSNLGFIVFRRERVEVSASMMMSSWLTRYPGKSAMCIFMRKTFTARERC